MAAWPDLGDRPFTATHLAVESFGAAEADATRALFAEHGLELSSLAYYDNNLHPDPAERQAVNDHVRRCIDAAAAARVPHGGHVRRPRTPAGRWPRTCADAEDGVPPARRPGRRAGRASSSSRTA